VSVVIAARNEEESLPELIDDLINQEYPLNKFEIIIVNDRSSDFTSEILKQASDNYSFIKTITINQKSKLMTSKKNAINEGIKISKGEIILATDADCRVGKLWMASMTYSLMNKNGIIVGYSEVDDIKNSFFEKYQKIDFLAILIANAGAAGWNQYWSGTGQNLAYYKNDYLKIEGFEPVKNKISGDDMYLVQSISKIKTGYVHIDPNSYVKTKAMSTIKDFLNQRIRWSSNSKSNFKNTPMFFMFLMVSFLENLFIFLSILLFKQGYLIWGIKIIFDAIVILFGSKLFNRIFDFKTYIIWAILQPIYIPLIGFLGLFNKFSWKK
jgi:cellulose synthase/poly-beta-1,6-N-acetylglucosamine synthase-like glycosyltransferase